MWPYVWAVRWPATAIGNASRWHNEYSDLDDGSAEVLTEKGAEVFLNGTAEISHENSEHDAENIHTPIFPGSTRI